MVFNATVDFASFTPVEAYSVLKPLVIFIIGMVIYAVFIYKFYRFLARKDVFKLDLEKYNKAKFGFFKKFVSVLLYIVEYLLLFPLLVFFWFLILAAFLLFLSKNHTVENVLLVAMAIVAAIRITAYYTEDLSRDLAKMVPFALLGVFIVDITFFDFAASLESLKGMLSFWKPMAYYLLFTILLEFVLRIVYSITLPFRKEKEDKEG